MVIRTNNQCGSCEALMINGIYCHETGCPDNWRTTLLECFECGCDFLPEEQYYKVCGDCASDRCWDIQHPDDN